MSRQLLSISKDGDSTAPLGNLCQSSITLPVERCFPVFRGKLLCFSLCSLPLVLSLGTSEISLAPSSLTSPITYLYTLIISTLGHLIFRLNSLSSLSLSSCVRCSHPFVLLCWTWLQYVPVPLVLGNPALDAILQVCLTSAGNNRNERNNQKKCKVDLKFKETLICMKLPQVSCFLHGIDQQDLAVMISCF